MNAGTIQQLADRVAQLMEQQLHIGGTGLAEKLRRGGRRLPRKVRRAGKVLAIAAAQSQNPRLLQQVDIGQASTAYELCVSHLRGLDRGERRKAMALSIAANVAFSLLAVFALVIVVLVWRGLL